MSSFEKSVKGATKVKLAPPKAKYVETLLQATHSGDAGVAEVFRTLTHRLHDSTWTVAFKALIIVHLMIKEGQQDVTLSFLSGSSRSILAVNQITDAQTQGQNIRRYSDYLRIRAQAYGYSKCDYVRVGDSRMKRLNVDKGLLRETEIVQEQIRALLKCDLLNNDPENEISLMAYRLLTRDLMDLYNAENEAVMNVLSRFFELSRPDAERAIRIYTRFCSQTAEVVQYLSIARQYSHATRLDIPKIKHAPTSLAKSLQEYLDDKDFEVNRSQYLAEQEAKRTGRPVQKRVQPSQPSLATSEPAKSSVVTQSRAVEAPSTAFATQPHKGPAPDLIDFFESIEQNQQTMAQNVSQFQQQSNSFVIPQHHQPQHQGTFGYQQIGQFTNDFATNGTNPFGQPTQQQAQPAQGAFLGSNFDAFGQQLQQLQQPQQQQQFFAGNAFSQEPQMFASPVQTQSPVPFPPPQQTGSQSTNPFRQPSIPAGGAPVSFNPANNPMPTRQSTNPFARSDAASPAAATLPYAPQQQQQAPALQTIQPQATGTNPFARDVAPAPHPSTSLSPLQVQQTGSTNPFRQSAFVNQQTGQGWQYAPQATIGGFDNLDTIPVFPRPGQTTGQ